MNHGHLDAVQNSNNQIIKEFSNPCSFGCFLEFGRNKASTFIRYLLELLKYSISKRWKHSNRLKERPDRIYRPINFLDNKIMRMVGQIRRECTRSLRIINEKWGKVEGELMKWLLRKRRLFTTLTTKKHLT